MKSGTTKRQRGAALLALLAVIALGASWFVLSRLNAESGIASAARKARNAEVLTKAKQALIGYVARQAAANGENNPGRLPCPEPAGYYGDPAQEGTAAGNCTLPAVGRLPWRTLGLDMLVDAAGEPLWYVVSPGWALSNSTTPPLTTYINSNFMGQLTVDGQANATVALIIAPGAAMNVQTAAGCSPRVQTRNKLVAPNYLDYLECDNATPTDSSFATTGPITSFNDHVLVVTAGDLMPSIEAGIASRFETEIAPQIKSAYSGGSWPTTPVLPFAATFANPTTSSFKGASGTPQGLLPLSYATTGSCGTTPCNPTLCTAGSDNRCDPAFVAWLSSPAVVITRLGDATLASYSCTVAAAQIACTIYVYRINLSANASRMRMTFAATASNVGMTLRKLNPTVVLPGLETVFGHTAAGVLNTDGSARVTLTTRAPAGVPQVDDSLCGLTGTAAADNECYQHTISVPIQLLSDHAVVDPANTTYNWFTRNKWHELSYYAVASGIAPSGARSCTDTPPPMITCLQVTYHPSNGKQRAILVLAGRALTGQDRSSSALTNWLEGANADGTSPFELRSAMLKINRTFNDRIAVIDSN